MEEEKRETPVMGDSPGDETASAATDGATGAVTDTAADPLFTPDSGDSSRPATAGGDTVGATAAASPAAVRRSPKNRGGNAGIIAGVAVVAPVLIRELVLDRPEPALLLPITMIALAVALSGFRVAQGGRDGTLGRIGLLIASAGCAILTVMFVIMAYQAEVQNTRLQTGVGALKLGFFLLLGGILIFGSASLVAGVISRGPMLLMMVSLLLGVILDVAGAFPGLRFRWGPISLGQGMHYGLKIFGLSLIWLGYSILKDSKAKAAAVARTAQPAGRQG